MKVLNALSRDKTEHGVYYYLASAVDAELAKKDAEIAHWKAGCIDTKLRDAQCRTLEDWRIAAMYYEINWSRCSHDFNVHASEQKVKIDALTAERDALREALGFYATQENWVSKSTGFAAQYDPLPSKIQKDRGNKARAALEQSCL